MFWVEQVRQWTFGENRFIYLISNLIAGACGGVVFKALRY
jgi:hypothetical protein